MLFGSPTGSCTRSELQSVLAEHRSALGDLERSCSSLKKGHGQISEQTDKMIVNLRRVCGDVQKLREEYEAMRDCLAACSLVRPKELQARMSNRRASAVLNNVLEARELVLHMGAIGGVTAIVHLGAASRAHAALLRKMYPELARRHPADIYVVGGKNDGALALATAEVFSPAKSEWRPLPSMRTPRYGCAAAALGGKLYVCGGHDGQKLLNAAERFCPTLGQWEPLPPMPTARSRCAAAALSGDCYVIGGRDSRNRATLAERFRPGAWRWEALPPMPLAPMGCSAAVVEGTLVVVGASADREMGVARFETQYARWSVISHIPRQRFGCGVSAMRGAVYVVGGHDGSEPVGLCERGRSHLLGGGEGSWRPVAPLPTPRHGCAATCSGGYLYVVGGDDGKFTGRSLAAVERFDPEAGRWSALPAVPTARFGCAAAAVFA